MKLQLLPVLALALTVASSPVAGPEAVAVAVAAAEAEAVSFPPTLPANLFKRADKTCKVWTGDGDVACRLGAGTGYQLKYRVGSQYRFGVRCKANGSNVQGNKYFCALIAAMEIWVANIYVSGFGIGFQDGAAGSPPTIRGQQMELALANVSILRTS